MPLGQGWLNAWIKVNSKHVVFPPQRVDSDAKHDNGRDNELQSARSSDPSTAELSEPKPENQAIKRLNNRKAKRRQQRRPSSDFFKRKGKSKDVSTYEVSQKSKVVHVTNDESKSSQQLDPKSANGFKKEPAAARIVERDDDKSRQTQETSHSLRFATGFLGAGGGVETYGTVQDDAGSVGRYSHATNDTMDEVKSAHMLHERQQLDTISVASRGGQSAPPRAQSAYAVSRPIPKEKNDNYFVNAQNAISLRFPFREAQGTCKNCQKLEQELVLCREDLEHLRNVVLRKEISFKAQKEDKVSHSDDMIDDKHNSLVDIAQRMSSMAARHKEEVEQLTQEKIRWQQDTHPKLQKFATLCKELDEEATLRNEEAIGLHRELDQVKSERDSMATDTEQLRFRVSHMEKESLESSHLRAKLKYYEEHGVHGAETSIRMRDTIIAGLMSRLDRALEQLNAEREQHLQRRQIIFPVARTSVSGFADGELMETDLRKTKASLREAEDAIERLKNENQKKEIDWMLKIESLTRRLEASGT